MLKVESEVVKSAKDLTGTIIAQKYKLLKLLGEGGMGTVYQAQDVLVNRTVALKVLKSETDNEEAVRRFQREATIAARIDSPYCIGLLDFGVADDRPFLVMPYVDGRPLSDVIDDGPLPPRVAIDIFLQICEGLEAAHAKGVVHRDIKPSNVILIPNADGYSVKILDFGIAKLREPDSTAARTMTGTGEFLGSPKYMSPEQCEGLPADHRSDIYSLGILMYETLTGAPPFKDDNVFAIIEKHRKALPEPLYLSGVSAKTAGLLQQIVFHCLEKLPTERISKISELKGELERASRTLSSTSSLDWPTFRLPFSRRIRIQGALVLLVGLLFLLVSFSSFLYSYSLLASKIPIEQRQIEPTMPREPLLSDAQKADREKLFKFKLASVKRIECDTSSDYVKLSEKAGDFFKSQNEPNKAMEFYGPAAVCLANMGLAKSREAAELYISQAECCVPLNYQLDLQRLKLMEAVDILRPFASSEKLDGGDELATVQLMRASVLLAQTDLKMAPSDRVNATWRVSAAEFAFKNVVELYVTRVRENLQRYPSYLIPTLTETGDYFYRRAQTAKDRDAVSRSIILARDAYSGARQQCEGNPEMTVPLLACYNRLGMLDLLAHDGQSAIADFRKAISIFKQTSNAPNETKQKILANLSDAYFATGNYADWLKIRLGLVNFPGVL